MVRVAVDPKHIPETLGAKQENSPQMGLQPITVHYAQTFKQSFTPRGILA